MAVHTPETEAAAKEEIALWKNDPSGNKITLINMVRARTGLGLKEAKDVVDAGLAMKQDELFAYLRRQFDFLPDKLLDELLPGTVSTKSKADSLMTMKKAAVLVETKDTVSVKSTFNRADPVSFEMMDTVKKADLSQISKMETVVPVDEMRKIDPSFIERSEKLERLEPVSADTVGVPPELEDAVRDEILLWNKDPADKTALVKARMAVGKAAADVLDAITVPVLSSGNVKRTSNTAATIGFTTSKAGTAHCLVVNSGSPAPTSATVRSGLSLGSVPAGAVANKAIALSAGSKDIYIVVQDNVGASAPLIITAADTAAPVLSSGSVTRPSNTNAVIRFASDEEGAVNFIVLNGGSPAPTSATVRSGLSLGSIPAGVVREMNIALTSGAKDIYVVVTDSSGNISAPLRLTAPDTSPPLLSAGNVRRTSNTAATIGFTTDEAGTAHCLVVNSGSAMPTVTAIRAGVPLGSVSAGIITNKAVALTSGAKDIYVVVTDAAGNISAPLKIPAPDTIPPVIHSGWMNRINDTAAVYEIKMDKGGRIYHLVLNSGSPAPTSAAVKAGVLIGSFSAETSGLGNAVSMTAGAKDVYFVVEDASGNISAPFRLIAPAYAPPVLSLGSVNRTSDTSATIAFTTNRAGTAHYHVMNSGTSALSNGGMKLSGNSLGAVPAGAVTNKTITLSAGAKDIYVVVEAAGSISASLRIPAATYGLLMMKTESDLKKADLLAVEPKVADLSRKVM
ncbi:MAG: ribosomal protein L7/L12 [Methanomassiliicoccaceae archaeon]|jgi:hypothetical protein|nr:ribosomal protein L7/L12 [Methanomassiliicoccaceae archaeon]